ncbi:lipid II:glycine glycyltransferase FemX [Vagococcus carniphilus]|uniref:lipid II:glycine glycyltransferase FemX n=1 Tax=Vagococcus carniphilus TaxID=218144 RepID=UPI0028906943|nr:GNAT family N-acetyltransferase [Vagococcus carniphilus]MDT2865749.1 GNAT family N-acetyltransferase [Vagococcus carniphilus]
MLRVLKIDTDEDEWNNIVMSFDNYDVYYLYGYVKAFHQHGDGEPLLFYYDDNNTRAINVVMKRDISKDKIFYEKIKKDEYFDFSTPYGYGGFLIEGDKSDEAVSKLDKTYVDYCMNNHVVSEFTRFHPVINNVQLCKNMYVCVDLSKTITIPLSSEKKVWEIITGKNRNVIRKSIKSGVEVFWGRASELIDSFIPMYNETMDRDNALDYYYFDEKFYESLLNDLKYNHLIFYAKHDGKVISMAVIIFANRQMHYHLSASNREYQHLSATNLLLYEAACWGRANNFNTLHLGGGLGSSEDNLFKFKKSFNKNSSTYFSIGKKIFDEKKYDELIKIRRNEKIVNDNFFPYYRAK